jgi:hypothetical protein
MRNTITAWVVVAAAFIGIGAADAQWQAKEGPLMTRWAAEVTPENVHQEYPRPQMVRDAWMNLNGLWDYAIRPKDDAQMESPDGQILVPFPVESALSGVMETVGAEKRLWYRRTFELPEGWGRMRVLLHFEAVDWETTVWVNGQEVGSHKGGYNRFSFDITDALNGNGAEDEIVLSVWDPTSDGFQPRGKQVTNPMGIFYTAVTGIWRTAWLEAIPEAHIKSLKIVPNVDRGTVRIEVDRSAAAQGTMIAIVVTDDAGLSLRAGTTGSDVCEVNIENAKLWSPDSPHLYDLKVTLLDRHADTVDAVTGYFGMRKIALGKDDAGVTRLFLNNEVLFQYGPLDQGWWPDGLYTAATDEALRYDVEVTKQLGFNMARKHVKIEPDRWYYWCDKLGLLVWQDMPSGDRGIGPDQPDIERTEESADQFVYELQRLVEGYGNHPSIVAWVPYNEGWGQWDTAGVVNRIREWDPSRLVIGSSGWAERFVGDMYDIHAYPGPAIPPLEENRAAVLGEFGGLGMPVEGHLWQARDNWGYRNLEGQDQLTAAYRDLLKQLHVFRRDGLAAAVYTQTSDVETEVNGLMTYDRAVIKMKPENMLRSANGYFPPVIESTQSIFLDELEVTLFDVSQPGDIFYTVDGGEPDKSSRPYVGAITLGKTATIKARTYWPDGTHSAVSEGAWEKVDITKAVNVDEPEKQLTYTYYELTDPRIEKLPDYDALVATSTGVTGSIDHSHLKRNELGALKFDGYIKVPADGVYTFYTNSDDGSKLYIGDVAVVENDFNHPMSEIPGHIALEAGYHPFRLTFYQGHGDWGLEVSYEGPGLEKQVIPSDVLFHD